MVERPEAECEGTLSEGGYTCQQGEADSKHNVWVGSVGALESERSISLESGSVASG